MSNSQPTPGQPLKPMPESVIEQMRQSYGMPALAMNTCTTSSALWRIGMSILSAALLGAMNYSNGGTAGIQHHYFIRWRSFQNF